MLRGTALYDLLNEMQNRIRALEEREGMGQDVAYPTYRYYDLYQAAGQVTGAGAAGTPLVVTADLVYALPLPIPVRESFSGAALRVTVGAAGNARIGVYQDGGAYPSRLVLDLGEVATGAVAVASVVHSFTLYKGLYWLAAIFSATPTVATLDETQLWVIGMDAGLTTSYYGLNSIQTYGALPSTLTPAELSLATGDQPLISLRKSL